jgi:phospholipid/cholesterol/gamma-HCH transport system substrate-binding protein
MNREFKVGLAVFIALVALGGIVFITGGALLRHSGNTFEILFPDVMGLEEGAPAYVSGLESGAVRSLQLVPEGVIVTVILDPSARIPKDSRIFIGTGGLLGKPLLRIERGSSPDFISTGERLFGEIPPDFDTILEELRDNLKALKATFGHFNELFGEPERKARLAKALDDLPGLVEDGRLAMRSMGSAGAEIGELTRQARKQVKSFSESLTELTRNLDRVVLSNEQDIRDSLSSLRSLLARLDKAFSQFDSDEMSGAELREAVRNIKNAASGLESLSKSLTGTFEDLSGEPNSPKTAQNLKKALNSAEKIISTVEAIQPSGEIAIHHRTSAGAAEAESLMDFSLLVGKEGSPWGFLVGASDLGNGGGGTVSAAYQTAWGRIWGGLVRGDVGAGAMVDLRSSAFPFSFSAEWWDDQGGSWAAKGKWHFNRQWGLFYERLEPGRNSPRDSFGLFYQF